MPTGGSIYCVPGIILSVRCEFSQSVLIITLEGRLVCDCPSTEANGDIECLGNLLKVTQLEVAGSVF